MVEINGNEIHDSLEITESLATSQFPVKIHNGILMTCFNFFEIVIKFWVPNDNNEELVTSTLMSPRLSTLRKGFAKSGEDIPKGLKTSFMLIDEAKDVEPCW